MEVKEENNSEQLKLIKENLREQISILTDIASEMREENRRTPKKRRKNKYVKIREQ